MCCVCMYVCVCVYVRVYVYVYVCVCEREFELGGDARGKGRIASVHEGIHIVAPSDLDDRDLSEPIHCKQIWQTVSNNQ